MLENEKEEVKSKWSESLEDEDEFLGFVQTTILKGKNGLIKRDWKGSGHD